VLDATARNRHLRDVSLLRPELEEPDTTP